MPVTNTLLTISMITREAAAQLVNMLKFARHVNRQYDNKFAVSGAKIGNSLNVRKPPRYLTTTGAALTINDSLESQATVTLNQEHVGLSFTSADLTLSIDDFSDRFIKPAVSALANKIDFDGALLYRDIFNLVGTVGGGNPSALTTYLDAQAKMLEEAAPFDETSTMAINPAQQAAIVNALTGLFQSDRQLREQYEEGTMGRAVGFKWVMDQNMRLHTNGTRDNTTPVTNGDQTGSSLICSGFDPAVTIKRGDVFTLTGVNAVNPQNRQSTGRLRQFVVTADATADGAGAVTLAISPPITPSGKDQTTTASSGNGTALTFNGAASAAGAQGLAFHRDAFVLAMADLELPKGVDFADRIADEQLGVSLRVIRDYDINNDAFPCRIDAMYGWTTVRPELACRISS